MFGRRYTLCTSVVLAIVSFLVFVESAPTSASTSSDEAMVTSKIEKVPVTPGVSGKKCGSFQNEGKNAAGKCGGEAEGMRNDSNMLPTTDSQEVTEKLEKLPCGSFQKDGKNETGKCGGVTDLLNGSSTSESQEVTEKPPKLPCGCNSTDHVHTTTKTTTFKTTTPCKKAVTRDPSKVRRCRGVRRGRYCYTIEHGAVCWGEAKTMCEKKDSVLAIINKRPVYRAVKRLIKRKAKSKETFFWVGMSYATSLGLKKWVNNKQVDKLSYWNAYKILEEKSGPVYEGCFGINSDSWNLTAVDCATKLPFICLYDITMKNQTEFLEAPAPSKLGGAFGVVAEENIKTGAIKHHHQIDIVLTPEQQEIVKTGGDPSTATGAFRFKTTTPTQSELQELFILQTRTRRISKRRKRSADPNRVWPRGVVNYIFHQLITSNEKALIKAALSEIEQRTCIRFKEGLDSSNIGVMFNTHDPRCASEVGRQGKLQNVYLSRDSCIHTQGSIIHEMFHVLGFWHEQARPDRDDYITINWQNIEQVYRVNFQIQSHSKYAGFNYDYESIMHYPQNAMATDPSIDTIIPNPNKWRQQTLGQRFAPTEMDYMELNSLYGCDQPTNGNWGVWSEWSQCPVTCGGGTHYRTRLCNNPAPANGGNGCPGEASQTQMCMRDSCPDPGWYTDSAEDEPRPRCNKLSYPFPLNSWSWG